MKVPQKFIDDSIADFNKHFGNHETPKTRIDLFGSEEMIVVENSFKRAIYSVRAELVKLINLKGEEK